MDERLRFVGRLLDGEAMTDVCREFGISRKTGYKIFDRYKEHGLEDLTDRSRRPVRYAKPTSCCRGRSRALAARLPQLIRHPRRARAIPIWLRLCRLARLAR